VQLHRSWPATTAQLLPVTLLAFLLAIVGAAGAGAAESAPVAHLHVGLVPEELGKGTTIEFGFTITGTGGGVPPPLTRMELRYPDHVGIVTSGLGIASCTQAVLEEEGVTGCPSRSLMGYGEATGEAVLDGELLEESGQTAIFMAPLANGQINLEFYVNGEMSPEDQLIFPGVLTTASPPYGGDLVITVPLLPTSREGPDIALARLHSTIGPLGVTYYARVHRQFVPYQPSGIILPPSCPRGGFPFAVSFAFANDMNTTSHDYVRCPDAHARYRRHESAPRRQRGRGSTRFT
jgi:hypothetical protein